MAQFKRPTGDVTVSGWHRDDGGVDDLYTRVNDTSPDHADYMQTAMLSASEKPVRVIMFVTDDQRRDDFWFTPQINARIRDQGVTFLSHRTDSATCAPARASIMSGFQQPSHLVTISDPNDYYRYSVQGKKINPSWWAGPWEKQYSTPRQAGDDPAQSSGSLPNWLVAAGITTGMIGKLQNAYARPQNIGGVNYASLDGTGTPLGPTDFPLCARRVPPDWHYFCGKAGDETASAGSSANWDGGNQDSYNEWFTEKLETDTSNIGTNTDTLATPTFHTYKKSIVSGSASANVATVTVTDHGMETDDRVIVKGCSPTAYNTSGEVTVTVVDADHFSYPIASTPGVMTGLGFAYPKKWYATAFLSDRLFSFLNRRADDEPWFAYVAVDAPHQGQVDSVEVEQLYLNTNDANDFMYYGGVAGAIAPTINTSDTPYAVAKGQWRQRHETLKSLDDLVARIDDYLIARGWADTIFILVGDQGCHYGEHGLWKDGGGKYFVKNTAYEVSCGAPLMMRYPGCDAGSTVNQATFHFDLPLTVLDFFGLTDHPAHDNRDGLSLLRMLDTNPYPDRAFYIDHAIPNQGHADALVDQDGYKWIDAVPTAPQTVARVEQLYYLPEDPDEATNLLITDPLTYQSRANTMRARAAVLKVARGESYRTG